MPKQNAFFRVFIARVGRYDLQLSKSQLLEGLDADELKALAEGVVG